MKKIHIVFFILLFITGSTLSAEDNSDTSTNQNIFKSESSIQEKIDTLLQNDFTEQALDLLIQGKKLFPNSASFYIQAGDIYADKELYDLALDEYVSASIMNKFNPDIIYKTSLMYSYLGKDKESAKALEQVISLKPDNLDAIADLGWIYFKLHRLQDGIALMENAIKHFGEDKSLTMTLGSLYSEALQYDNAKKAYLSAIKNSKKEGSKNFTSIALYNLSLLELRYYHFEEGLETANLSLLELERTSAHLAKGELFVQAQDFNKALEEYKRAYELDSSPLSKLNMAELYLEKGQTETARVWLNSAKNHKNSSWMANYGTDTTLYETDILEIETQLYKNLAIEEQTRIKENFFDSVASFFKTIWLNLQALYYEYTYYKYSSINASNYKKEGNDYSSNAHYALAFKKNPILSEKYLYKAVTFEEKEIPESRARYLLEKERANRNINTILNAIQKLNQNWEKDIIADSYEDILRFSFFKNTDQIRQVTQELYKIKPYAVRRSGGLLPIKIQTKANSKKDLLFLDYYIIPGLKQNCFEILSDSSIFKTPYLLKMSFIDETIHFELEFDFKESIKGSIPVKIFTQKEAALVCNLILETIYKN